MKQRYGNLMIGSGILLLVFLAFGKSITQDFASLDDSFLILNNLAVRGPTLDHIKTVFTSYDPELYIPLTFVSFQVNYLMSGLAPWSYHLTNIVLHAANALLVGWFLLLLTKRRGIALASTLLFAVHPLHTEAVAWVAGRKDLLATFFFLLSTITYLQWRERGWQFLVMSLVLFICALLSKVVTVTLPLVLILTDLFDHRRIDRRMIAEKIPYVLLSGIFLGIAFGGKERVLQSSSLWETALMGMKSSVFYIEKLIAPLQLTVFYPFDGSITLASPTFFVPAIVVLSLIGIAFWFYRRAPWLFFGIFFYFITLTPTFFNFHKGEQMFFAVDRYAYIPSIGFLLIAMMGGSFFIDRFAGHAASLAKRIVMMLIILLFTILSMLQTRVWDSPESLYVYAMELYPMSPFIRANVSMLYRETGDLEKSFSVLKDGLKYGNAPALSMEAGLTYSAAGQVEDARAQFKDVLRMDPKNPDAHYDLGFLAEYEGKTDEAEKEYARAVGLDSSYVVARVALGNILLLKGKIDLAKEQYEQAIAWNQNAVDARIGLAAIYTLNGDDEASQQEITLAKELDTNAEQRLATLLSLLK